MALRRHTRAWAAARSKSSLHPDFYTAAFGKFPHSPYNTAFPLAAHAGCMEPYNTHIKTHPYGTTPPPPHRLSLFTEPVRPHRRMGTRHTGRRRTDQRPIQNRRIGQTAQTQIPRHRSSRQQRIARTAGKIPADYRPPAPGRTGRRTNQLPCRRHPERSAKPAQNRRLFQRASFREPPRCRLVGESGRRRTHPHRPSQCGHFGRYPERPRIGHLL